LKHPLLSENYYRKNKIKINKNGSGTKLASVNGRWPNVDSWLVGVL